MRLPLLLTTSVLLLELAVSRIFSVVLFYHYAFLVISLAILGLASGAVLVRLFPLPRNESDHHKRTTMVCIAAVLAILPALIVAMNTNVWLVTSMETAKRLAFIFFIFLIPFTLAGYAIASTMVVWAVLALSCRPVHCSVLQRLSGLSVRHRKRCRYLPQLRLFSCCLSFS
jgi:hypothetical protein